MTETLFKEVGYSRLGLVNEIEMGDIGLPGIQRSFVWISNIKERDLHALPPGWGKMEYHEFIDARRKLMAKVIRSGFDKLCE